MVRGCAQKGESSKALPKLSVKFILHATGNIAAKFLYDPVMISHMPLYYLFFPILIACESPFFFSRIMLYIMPGTSRGSPQGPQSQLECKRKVSLFTYMYMHTCVFVIIQSTLDQHERVVEFFLSAALSWSLNLQVVDFPSIFFVVSRKSS